MSKLIVVGGRLPEEKREAFKAAIEEQRRRDEEAGRMPAVQSLGIRTDKWFRNKGKGRYAHGIGERVFSERDCREKARLKGCVYTPGAWRENGED